MSPDEDRTIKSVDTVFDIIDVIEEGSSSRTTDIAEGLDYSRSTIHYYLQTLERRGYVRRTDEGEGGGDGGYELGPEFLRLGGRILARTELRRVAAEPLRDLSRQTPGVACLAGRFGDRVVVVRTRGSVDSGAEGPTRSDVFVGTPVSLDASAYGRAVLADPSGGAAEAFDVEGVDDELADDLDRVDDRGFAFDDEGEWPGLRSAAVPVSRDGDTVGAVGITGPVDRIDDPREHTKERRFTSNTLSSLRQTARSIQNRLGAE